MKSKPSRLLSVLVKQLSSSQVCDSNLQSLKGNSISAAPPTLQSLHPVQLGEELVDDAVGDPRAVVAPPGCQRLKLVEEEDAGFGRLSPETQSAAGN